MLYLFTIYLSVNFPFYGVLYTRKRITPTSANYILTELGAVCWSFVGILVTWLQLKRALTELQRKNFRLLNRPRNLKMEGAKLLYSKIILS